MTWRDALRLAMSGLRGGVVRTLLTILGLGVGVGAVLTVLTLGNAGEVRVEAEIAKLGVDKVWIRAKNGDYSLTPADSSALFAATNAPACAGAYTAAAVGLEGTSVIAQIAGYDQAMQLVHTPKLLEGRMLTAQDFERGSPVCLVDEALADQLGSDVIGKRLTVGNRRLRIVGMIKGLTMQSMSAGSGLLLTPLSTFLDTFGGEVAEITLSVQQGQNTEAVAETALKSLSSADAFRADTLEKEINAAREIVRIFVMVLVCVAAVCMLTGSIGVMNVLLISVRERRREIGLIKAIGGTSAQVGLLFLLEAAVYALLGGFLGVLLGIVMIGVFGQWIGLNARLEAGSAIPVLIATAALGISVGVAPAIKAAGMQPVDALQSE